MSYTLKDDEVGLIIRPVYHPDETEWSGEVTTNIIMSGKGEIDTEVKMELLNVITLMSAFLDYGYYNPDVLDDVMDYRDELMEDAYKEEVKKAYSTEDGSNVVTLTQFTKTRGSA